MAKAKENTTPRLLEKYKNDIIPGMVKKFNYKNIMQAYHNIHLS